MKKRASRKQHNCALQCPTAPNSTTTDLETKNRRLQSSLASHTAPAPQSRVLNQHGQHRNAALWGNEWHPATSNLNMPGLEAIALRASSARPARGLTLFVLVVAATGGCSNMCVRHVEPTAAMVCRVEDGSIARAMIHCGPASHGLRRVDLPRVSAFTVPSTVASLLKGLDFRRVLSVCHNPTHP